MSGIPVIHSQLIGAEDGGTRTRRFWDDSQTWVIDVTITNGITIPDAAVMARVMSRLPDIYTASVGLDPYRTTSPTTEDSGPGEEAKLEGITFAQLETQDSTAEELAIKAAREKLGDGK